MFPGARVDAVPAATVVAVLSSGATRDLSPGAKVRNTQRRNVGIKMTYNVGLIIELMDDINAFTWNEDVHRWVTVNPNMDIYIANPNSLTIQTNKEIILLCSQKHFAKTQRKLRHVFDLQFALDFLLPFGSYQHHIFSKNFEFGVVCVSASLFDNIHILSDPHVHTPKSLTHTHAHTP